MIDPADPDFTNTPVSEQRPHFGYAPARGDAAPALSIITPFYDTGAIFHETASSVLQQSMQQFEWIIVNDGSTDPEALAILDSYRHSDPRIRVIDYPHNKGLSAARNTAFAAAHTDFVLQLDSDDLLEPTAAEKWYWFLTSYPEYGFVKSYTAIFGARQRLRANAFEVGPQFLTGNRVNPTALVRRSVHRAVCGYDESIREGLEDWEFWVRCANGGYWGGCVPEYLDWRRRRADPGDRWANLRSGERSTAMHRLMRQRYPRLWTKDGFPRITLPPQPAFAAVSDDLPCANLLAKNKPRLLLIARCLAVGGGSKFKLDLVEQLVRRGWDITIAVTDPDANPWLAQFARFTPDIFILPNMARLTDYPRLLRYLAQSRQVDAIFLTGSEIGYHLAPYLRAHFPDIPLVDYCHFEEPERNNGGFARLSLVYGDLLQAKGVSSQHLKQWMVERGAPAEKIGVHYTNIDASIWRPDADARARVRQELAIGGATPVILFAGHITPQKQPRVLARTALQLRRQGRDFVLLVAGRGPDLPWLRRFVAKHRMQSYLRLLGEAPLQRIRELLAASDIFFLPSRNEGVSLVIYEAMATGLAIVSADVGGQSELVTPDCGVLAAHGSEDDDVELYTQILADLLAQPERRQAIGAAGRRRVQERFRLHQMAEGIISMLQEAQPRCADSGARPALAAGYASAVQAVEYARLAREAAAAATAPAIPPGRLLGAQARLVRAIKGMTPAPIKRAIRRMMGWPETPR